MPLRARRRMAEHGPDCEGERRTKTSLSATNRLLAASALVLGGLGVLGRPAAAAVSTRHHAAPVPLLIEQGNGSLVTKTFRAPREWRIVYTFSHCLKPSFVIFIVGGLDDVLSIVSLSGQGTQYEHAGGRVSLRVSTTCSWRIAVLAGGLTVNGIGFRWSGKGIENTMNLRVPSRWRISYRFSDCSLIPNFAITIHHGSATTVVAKLGIKGAGSRVEHIAGIVYLNTNNTCAWRIAIGR